MSNMPRFCDAFTKLSKFCVEVNGTLVTFCWDIFWGWRLNRVWVCNWQMKSPIEQNNSWIIQQYAAYGRHPIWTSPPAFWLRLMGLGKWLPIFQKKIMRIRCRSGLTTWQLCGDDETAKMQRWNELSHNWSSKKGWRGNKKLQHLWLFAFLLRWYLLFCCLFHVSRIPWHIGIHCSDILPLAHQGRLRLSP